MKDLEEIVIVQNFLDIANAISKNHESLAKVWINLYIKQILSDMDVLDIQTVGRPNITDLDLATIIIIRVKKSMARNAFTTFVEVLREQGFVELSVKLEGLHFNAKKDFKAAQQQKQQVGNICPTISSSIRSQDSIGNPSFENDSFRSSRIYDTASSQSTFTTNIPPRPNSDSINGSFRSEDIDNLSPLIPHLDKDVIVSTRNILPSMRRRSVLGSFRSSNIRLSCPPITEEASSPEIMPAGGNFRLTKIISGANLDTLNSNDGTSDGRISNESATHIEPMETNEVHLKVNNQPRTDPYYQGDVRKSLWPKNIEEPHTEADRTNCCSCTIL